MIADTLCLVNEVSHRLRARRLESGFKTAEAFAEHIAMEGTTYRSYDNGNRPLTIAAAKLIAPGLKDTTWQWLMLGEDASVEAARELEIAAGRQEASRPTKLPKSIGADGLEFRGGSYVALGVFDIQVSAGPGSISDGSNQPDHYNLYRMDWLRNLTKAPPSALAVLRVSGDSMQSTLHNGDQVLVDRTVRSINRDGIYVIRRRDELQVKRVSVHPVTGVLTVRSDNPSYEVFKNIKPDDLSVEGRVIWLSRNIGG